MNVAKSKLTWSSISEKEEYEHPRNCDKCANRNIQFFKGEGKTKTNKTLTTSALRVFTYFHDSAKSLSVPVPFSAIDWIV